MMSFKVFLLLLRHILRDFDRTCLVRFARTKSIDRHQTIWDPAGYGEAKSKKPI